MRIRDGVRSVWGRRASEITLWGKRFARRPSMLNGQPLDAPAAPKPTQLGCRLVYRRPSPSL